MPKPPHTGWRHELRLIAKSAPGKRFQDRYERHRDQSLGARIRSSGIGVVLILAGLAMLVLPGPGLFAILVGLGMCAGQSQTISGWLDHAELLATRATNRLRRRKHGRILAAIFALFLGACGVAILVAFWWLFYR